MFIINLIPLHVFVLMLMQRYSRRVYIGKTHTHTSFSKFKFTIFRSSRIVKLFLLPVS